MTYPRLDLNGKVAVVIGGTSGIGFAIAKGMAEAGADVVPTSRRQDQVEADKKENGRWQRMFHLCEGPVECSAHKRPWHGAGNNRLTHMLLPDGEAAAMM